MELKKIVVLAALTLLLIQFLASGFFKITHTRSCSDAKLLDELFGDRCGFNMSVLILAGIWELIASLIALTSAYFDIFPELRRLALLSLALFTIIATLMFKIKPKLKYYGIMSNISVTGGLILASFV